MPTAGHRSSLPSHISNRPPISFSSYCLNTAPGLMQRSLDEIRLTNKRRTIECYRHSTPLSTTGNFAFQSLSSLIVHRRKHQRNSSQMTSFSALKRRAQRFDSSRFQVHLEHVLGFTSISNSVVSQNQSTLVYAAGSTVVLYDIDSRKEDFIINNARKSITSLAISPDGRYLATGEAGHDPKVRIWDLQGDRTVPIELADHKYAVDCVCFSPNVDRLVSIGSLHDGNIYVWNWKEKKKFASNKCTCSVRRVAFAEDGSYFVTVGHRHVKFWYLISTTSLEVVPLRGRYAILAERKDNYFTDVVCGRGDCAGMTYAITSTGLLCQFDEHRQIQAEQDLQEKTNCLAIGDSYLVVGCIKGAAYVFSPQTLDYLMSIPLPHYLGVDVGCVTSIAQMSPSSRHNVSFPDTIALCLDEDKSRLTCFYNDHSFYVWNMKKDRTIEKFDSHLFHSGCGWAIEAYSHSTSSILSQLSFITCSSDNSIRFWSLNSNSTNIFSRQLLKILYLDDDCSKLCDSQTNQLDRPEFVAKIGGRCLKINPDGLSMAIGDRNGNVRIFDLQTFQQIALLEAHDSEVLSVDYSRSSSIGVTFLASSSRDRFIHIFDVDKDYQLITTLDDHSAAITAVKFIFSPITSNLQLISCGADKSLIFRSISKNDQGKYQFVRSNNIVEKQTFYDLTIDPSRETVSAACQDRMIRVYNLQDGKRLRINRGSMSDDLGYLIKIDFDPLGRYLATSCSNKCVYLWDTQTNECLASLYGHGEIVTDLKFNHDGSFLYTISGDSCVFVWNIVDSMNFSSELDDSMSQTPSIIEEHRPFFKHQRSLWSTDEPNLPPFERKLFRSPLPDVVNEDTCHSINSSQDDESIYLDEDDDGTYSELSHPVHRFLTENYDHEHSTSNVDEKFHQRKSVSARFRSVSKEITITDRLCPTTMQDESSQRKGIRSQISDESTDSKTTVSGKSSTTRQGRINRTRSEDRFHGSSLSLSNASIDSGPLPSYAAHTSSSMNKLRENSVSSPPPIPSVGNPSLPIGSINVSSHLTRRTPSVVSSNSRSASTSRKNLAKSSSTQNLILSSTAPVNINQSSKIPLIHRLKTSSNFPRRPPNLPTKSTTTTATATISSSSTSTTSSNSSSPTKTVPLTTTNPIDQSTDDSMPKWAQDCFYRTVVLGLKPLLLQDIPTSPIQTDASPIDQDEDPIEITTDYQQIPLDEKSVHDDRRVPMIDHLVHSLNQHLHELEHFYSTVSNSSNRDDLILKQYIEEIFRNLHRRIPHYQQDNRSSVVPIAD